MLTALRAAAGRGVEVTILLPKNNDSRLVQRASSSHYDDLLSAGVRIEQFEGGLLHAKTVTIDREVAIIGTVNLDQRSIWLNFEVSLFVYDRAFCSALRRPSTRQRRGPSTDTAGVSEHGGHAASTT